MGLPIIIKKIFLKILLSLNLFKPKAVEPNKKTLEAFEQLNFIYQLAEKNNIKLWLAGSWAVTAIYGDFFKQYEDIDFTLKSIADMNKFKDLLTSQGYLPTRDTTLGAIALISPKGIPIDFGTVELPGSPYTNIPLEEEFLVKFKKFKYRVIFPKDLLNIYLHLLFFPNRNLKLDLIKWGILNSFKY
jgi:hypothetical protein